ncbi:hypothetical protein GUJ93_ZPchr0012g21899 [Zizania palustris]|uniref:Cation/H+ exchanger transmembrane domain-containing protein n=1 Tax=Zizania palustris TaxID=103762 RepID=A0A8J6BVZ3_ZIZPA|nr:hypothetical protein GUJ93_ZPchr0012g21899 [Zizania palustris]
MLTRRRAGSVVLLLILLVAAAVAFCSAAAAGDGEARAGEAAEAVARGEGAEAAAEAGGEVVAEAAAGNTTAKEGSLADMIDRALEKEFPSPRASRAAEVRGSEKPGPRDPPGVRSRRGDLVPELALGGWSVASRVSVFGWLPRLDLETDPGSFNNTVAEKQGVLETVARRVTKKNETKDNKSFPFKEVFLDRPEQEDVPTLIDRKDNVFIISNPKSKYPVLQLDLRLISDLVVVIVSATCGGIAFACLGQPVITGYLLAGSIIGPGGFSFVSEMVQVETVAQFGVIFLLFALGLEFSTAKLRVVRAVAVLGGLLQIILFMLLCGISATLCGGKTKEGVFVGVLLSMSSTAVVLKFLMERNRLCCWSSFALLPILSGASGLLHGVASMAKSLVVLLTFLAILSILSRTGVPWFLKLMISLSSQTNELYQLAAVAFCLLFAWCSDKLGLSLELGSFAAGVMISTTDLAQHTLEQIEPIRNFFAALFLASIGMLINVHFLWNHVDILLAAVILVITVKTFIVAVVVKGFGYSNKTSLLVGMSLAQIGEFAFVLLSRASSIHLIEGKLYLLLLGTTALSLVTTPLLFKMIPAVVHLGVLLRWFSVDSNQVELGLKSDGLRIDSSKRINLIVQGSHHS